MDSSFRPSTLPRACVIANAFVTSGEHSTGLTARAERACDRLQGDGTGAWLQQGQKIVSVEWIDSCRPKAAGWWRLGYRTHRYRLDLRMRDGAPRSPSGTRGKQERSPRGMRNEQACSPNWPRWRACPSPS